MLTLLVLASAVLSVTAPDPATNVNPVIPAPQKTNPSVIIIGAGPSGIAAATRLHSHDINVTVLEAENRIGGRIHSVPFGDAVVDLGAEWCHGEKGNIVYEMVKDLGVLGRSEFHYMMYGSDRVEIDAQLSYDLHEIFDTIYKADGDKKQLEGVSVGEYFIKTYNTTIAEQYSNDDRKLLISRRALELFHHYILSSEGAFSWFDPSATSDYRNCDGDLNLNWGGRGYKTVLDILMRKFPTPDAAFDLDSRILLGKEAKFVSWGDGVTVSCKDGTIVTADFLIFTGSLGVLKGGYRRMFLPPLPRNKGVAIRDLGFGAVMKVMMHFEESWWDRGNFTGMSFVWAPHHKEMLVVEFPKGPKRHGRSWLLDLMGVYPVANNPKVLSAWFTGDLVPQIERVDNATVVEGVHFVLDKFVGHIYNVTRPKNITMSNWYTNPHFRGTYSFQTSDSRKVNPSSNLVLSEPLVNIDGTPTVLFAGEATHPRYYSTVHGAIETGFREADRILNYMKSKDNLV